MRELMRQLRRNTGQATVEYLLLIVVVIALALSIGKPLGDYLIGFSSSMLGPEDSYYACLTELAKLPGDPVSCGDERSLLLSSAGDLKIPSTTPGGGGGSGGGGVSGGGDGFGGGDGSGGGDDSGGEDSDGDDSRDGDADSDSDSNRDRDGRGRGSRQRGKDSAGDRKSLPKTYRVDSGSDSLSGGADSSLIRDQNQSEFLASLPSSSNLDEEDDDEDSRGSIRRRGRGKKNRGFGSKFDDSDQKGYKQSRFRGNSEFAVGYLGERFVEEEEKESPKVFKSDAIASLSSGAGIKGEDQKSANDGGGGSNGGPPPDVKPKKINLMQFIRYLVLAILIILVLAFLFSQTMEYQSRD